MKQILTSLALIIALNSFGQTIDTTVHNCTAAKINSVVVNHGFPSVNDTLDHVGFFDYTDDFKGNCVVNWVVISKGLNISFDKYKLGEGEYNNWDGSAEGLLRVIATFLKLTFK
jgi:hypothetical protein